MWTPGDPSHEKALVMIAVVAVLTGMYLLRRYARAELLEQVEPVPDRPEFRDPVALEAREELSGGHSPHT